MSLIGDVGAVFRARLAALAPHRSVAPTRAVALEQQIATLRAGVRAVIDGVPASSARQVPVGDQVAHLRAVNADAPSATSRVPSATARVDDFRNLSTGIGVRGFDKRRGRGQWGYAEQSELESRFVWRGSDMADRAVSKLVDEIFREGVRVRVAGDKELSEDIERGLHDIGMQAALSDAMKFARAFGGCGLFLGADDGTRDLSLPLNEARIRSFDFVQPFSPLELVPVTWYADPLRPKFGTPETYRLTPLDSPPGWSPTLYTMPVIHESRVIPFQGNVSWRGQIIYNVHPGWGDSVFVRIRQALEDFEQSWGALGILVSDFSVATLKIKDLAMLLSAGQGAVENRAQVLEDTRSVARVTIVDADEEFKRETTSVTGLPELIDRISNRLAAAMDLPVSLMLGQEPAGLNATGDSDIRWWYGTVAAQQRAKVKPPLEKILRLRFLARNSVTKGLIPDRWGVHFPSLWRPSETEQALIRFQQAQTDQIYVNTGVLSPAEVAVSRFGGEEYSTDTQIDSESRSALEEPDDTEPEPAAPLPPGIEDPSELPTAPDGPLGFGDAIHEQPRAVSGRVMRGAAGPTKFAAHSAQQLHEVATEIDGDEEHPDAIQLKVELKRRGLDAPGALARAAMRKV